MFGIDFPSLFQIYSVKSINARLLETYSRCSRAEEERATEAFKIIGEEYIEVLGQITNGQYMRMKVRSMICDNLYAAVHWYQY